jgi:hypothetical protein
MIYPTIPPMAYQTGAMVALMSPLLQLQRIQRGEQEEPEAHSQRNFRQNAVEAEGIQVVLEYIINTQIRGYIFGVILLDS